MGKEIRCPECGSTDIAKDGFRGGKRGYRCRKCGRRFVEKSSRKVKYGRRRMKEIKKLAIGLVKSGKSAYKTASELGISPVAVWRWCKEAGVKLYRGRKRGGRHEEWREERLDGITYRKSEEFDMLLLMELELSTAVKWMPHMNGVVCEKMNMKWRRYIGEQLDPLLDKWVFDWIDNDMIALRELLYKKLEWVRDELKKPYKYIRIIKVDDDGEL